MLKAPTKYQKMAIEEQIRAYTNLIQDSLADLGVTDADNKFNALIDLITLEKKHYTNEVLNLPIGEVVAQEDVVLKHNIQLILPTIEKADIAYIYTSLYKLFHEFRLNKSPDCPFADENNAVVLGANNGHAADLYDNTYQKNGVFASRVKKDGQDLSSDDMNVVVVEILKAQKKLIEKPIAIPSDSKQSEVQKVAKEHLEKATKETSLKYTFEQLEEKLSGQDFDKLSAKEVEAILQQLTDDKIYHPYKKTVESKSNTTKQDYEYAKKLQQEEEDCKMAYSTQEKDDKEFALALQAGLLR